MGYSLMSLIGKISAKHVFMLRTFVFIVPQFFLPSVIVKTVLKLISKLKQEQQYSVVLVWLC